MERRKHLVNQKEPVRLNLEKKIRGEAGVVGRVRTTKIIGYIKCVGLISTVIGSHHKVINRNDNEI